jgi:hypothetical protein
MKDVCAYAQTQPSMHVENSLLHFGEVNIPAGEGFSLDCSFFSSFELEHDIDGMCKDKYVNDAFDLYFIMVPMRVSPNCVTYNTLIRGL